MPGLNFALPIVVLYNTCMDDNTRDIIDSLAFIKENMATKDELAEVKDDIAGMVTKDEFSEFREEVRSEFRNIHRELVHINARLDQLEENYRNLKGVTKEIDELRERMAAIERHLGLHHRIAA